MGATDIRHWERATVVDAFSTGGERKNLVPDFTV